MWREMARVKITQTKSRIGSTKNQRANLDALGLHKIGQSVEHDDSPIILGMLTKVKHLVRFETIAGEKPARKAATPKAAEAKAEATVEAKAEVATEVKAEVAEVVAPKAEKAEKADKAEKPTPKKAPAGPKAEGEKAAAAKKPAAPKKPKAE